MNNQNIKSEPVACPYCGQGEVMAKIFTIFTYKSEHPVFTDGVDMDGDTMGQIFGDFAHKPLMQYRGFRCTSCGKKWSKSEYSLVKDEQGVNSFVKTEPPLKKSKTK